LPCVYLYKRLLANLQEYECGGYDVRGRFPPPLAQLANLLAAIFGWLSSVTVAGYHLWLTHLPRLCFVIAISSRHNEVG